jgi:hypothetical protein
MMARRGQDAAAPARFPRRPQPLDTIGPAMRAEAQERAALRFAIAILLACLLLQRFAVPFAGFPLGIVGPLGLVLAGFELLRGTLVFDRVRLCIYLVFLAFVLAGAAANAAMGPRFGLAPSWPSLMHFVGLTAFATLSFARPVGEARLFRAVSACLGVAAAAALLQFVAQFAGLALFSFRGIVPDPFLLELLYNPQIPIGDTSYFKANGFFLLEPSILSQFMAIGIILEVLYFRRPRMLALFLGALLVSVSGTGWLVLGAFVAGAVLGMGRRGIALAAVLLLALAAGLAVLSLVLPEVFQSFIGRVNEISVMDTSAHQRFVTPFWALQEVVDRVPWTLLFGVGASIGESLPLPYNYFLNTPVKLTIEFGLPVVLAYVALFSVAARTQRQAPLLLPGLVMLLFAGPYQQLAPVLFAVLLIMTVARLSPEPVASAGGGTQPARPVRFAGTPRLAAGGR